MLPNTFEMYLRARSNSVDICCPMSANQKNIGINILKPTSHMYINLLAYSEMLIGIIVDHYVAESQWYFAVV